MFRPTLRVTGFVLFLSCLIPVARALPGDAGAVLAHCGPASDDQVSKPSNGPQERVLTYNSIALRFQPADGDWSFAAASDSGVPMTLAATVKRMPCLGDAMEEVAARPPAENQPSTEASSAHSSVSSTNDIFLFVVGLVVCGIVFFAIRPYMKSEPKRVQSPEPPRAPRRRPSATGIEARPRKPADPPSSGTRRASPAQPEGPVQENPGDGEADSETGIEP